MKEEIKQEELEVKEVGKISDEELKGISGNKKIMQVILEDDKERYYCYFKRPSIQTLSAMTKLAKTDEVKGMEVFINHCYVAGSKAWENDGVLFMTLSTELTKVLNSVKASLKNL